MNAKPRFLGGSGLAAVEFALIAPVLTTALLGMIELTFLYSAQGKVNWMAESVADLICQSSSQTSDSLGKLGVAAQEILNPLITTGRLTVDAVSIILDSSNKIVVDPSWGGVKTLISGTGISVTIVNYSSITPPPTAGGSIIYVIAYYRMASPTGLFQSEYILSSDFVMKPRLVPKIGYS